MDHGEGERNGFSKRLAWNKSIFNDFNNNRYSNQCLPAANTLVNYSFSFFLAISLFSFSLATVFCLRIRFILRVRLNSTYLITVFCALTQLDITDNQIIYVSTTYRLLVGCLASLTILILCVRVSCACMLVSVCVCLCVCGVQRFSSSPLAMTSSHFPRSVSSVLLICRAGSGAE